jgi:hypothetical protein
MRITSMSRLILLALAGAGLVIVGARPTQGADPFVAGGRSTRFVAMSQTQTDRALARAADLAQALKLPGVTRRAERLDDRFEHRVYDEVVSVDAAGDDASIVRFDTNGEVVMAIALGWQREHGPAVDRGAAASRALQITAAAGLKVQGRPIVAASAGAGGWSVAWPRNTGGIPVLGDGVRVSLWADGSFHALTRMERPLAPASKRRVSAEAARNIAQSVVAESFAGAAKELRVAATELAWVAPNDTWAPQRPDAPEATLRLAWIVRFESSGKLAERVRFLEYWLDAGDGSVLGGDVVE